ncbi:MAG: thymidine phosphorylase [Armatimonadota bacterium]
MSQDIRRLSERKRHGEELAAEELRWLVEAYTGGGVDDAAMAAWLMAVCCAGMSDEETWHLTDAMARSGALLDLSGVGRPTVDKHSTGGVGDKVTLVAAPIAAACGACVAKMSGRGLGHTGGTIDKLEAIPGLTTDLSPERFVAQAREVGLVIAAQSAALAPADGKMYALRDATGTVDSRPLIAASIMSKKIAAGAGAIVLEVTVGSGAFMRDLSEARALARLMVELGRRAGRRVGAVLTDMNQPLGQAVGNAIEVTEAVKVLRGEGPEDVRELSVCIAAWMLVAAGIVGSFDAGQASAREALRSGAAMGKFAEMVAAQGGDVTALDRPLLGYRPGERGLWRAQAGGIITRMDARGVGYAAVAAGAGRQRKGEVIDPAAGLRLLRKEGDRTARGAAVAEVMLASEERRAAVEEELGRAIMISSCPPEPRPLIIEAIAPGGPA